MTSGVRDKIISSYLPSECTGNPSQVVESRNGTYKSWLGNDSPKEKGKLILQENPYKMTSVSMLDDSSAVLHFNGTETISIPCTVQSSCGYWFAPPDPGESNTELKAWSKVFEDIKNSDFRMDVLIGEGAKTLNMIGDTSRNLATFLSLLRDALGSKGRDKYGRTVGLIDFNKLRQAFAAIGLHGDLSNIPRELSNAWLVLSYGWGPLLQDIIQGLAAVESILNSELQTTVNQSAKLHESSRFTAGADNLHDRDAEVLYAWNRRKSRIRAKFSRKPPVAVKLGLNSPFGLAWELTPYSFVADWFVDVSGFLKAHDDMRTLQPKGVSITNSHETNVPRARNESVAGGTLARFKHFELERKVFPDGVPAYNLPLPTLKPSSSLRHAISGLALFITAARR